MTDGPQETRAPVSSTPVGSLRRAGGHLGRLALGLIFLAAGMLKSLDPLEFAHQMSGYGIVTGTLAAIAAPALIVFEIMLGVTLIAGIRPVLTGLVSVLLLLAFIGIEAYGLMTGRTESCGCFGAYVQRTPAEVIGEDLVFVGLGALVLWGLRDWSGMRSGRAAAVLITALLLSATFVVASPSLPIDAYVTRLRLGRSVADLDLAARVPELQQGRHLVALIDVTDPGTPGVASALDLLIGQPGALPVIGLTPSTEQEIDAFRWTSVPTFEIHRIDRDVIKRLYRRLPRFFVVDSGRVATIFDDAPPGRQDLLSWKP